MAHKAGEANGRPQTAAGGRDSAGHGAKSAAARERAVLALLSESTIAKAAAKCHVGDRTLRRWMSEDETFKRELAEARRLTFEAGMNRVEALTAQAIETLAELMSRRMPPNVRLGAARTVAELGLHQHDAEAILRRLDEIEEHQRQADSRTGL
jgi:hypothetical protein